MAESADAPDLKSGSFRSVGSSPTAPTRPKSLQKSTFLTNDQRPPSSMTGAFGSSTAAVDYDSASSIAAAACSRMFGSTWEYVSRVMAMVACPSISETIFGFTLRVRSSVAHVCRRSYS